MSWDGKPRKIEMFFRMMMDVVRLEISLWENFAWQFSYALICVFKCNKDAYTPLQVCLNQCSIYINWLHIILGSAFTTLLDFTHMGQLCLNGFHKNLAPSNAETTKITDINFMFNLENCCWTVSTEKPTDNPHHQCWEGSAVKKNQRCFFFFLYLLPF